MTTTTAREKLENRLAALTDKQLMSHALIVESSIAKATGEKKKDYTALAIAMNQEADRRWIDAATYTLELEDEIDANFDKGMNYVSAIFHATH